MAKPKANQKETVKFSYERIARFFPPEYSTKQMEDAIVRILEERKREVGAMPSPRRRDDAESPQRSRRERDQGASGRGANARSARTESRTYQFLGIFLDGRLRYRDG